MFAPVDLTRAGSPQAFFIGRFAGAIGLNSPTMRD